MAVADDKTRITVTIPQKVYDELSKYGDRFNKAESQMSASIIEIGIENIQAYEKWFLNLETAFTLGVTMDSVCSAFGLPRFFESTKEDELIVKELRKRRQERKALKRNAKRAKA